MLRPHTATYRIKWQSFTQLIEDRRWFSVELRRRPLNSRHSYLRV